MNKQTNTLKKEEIRNQNAMPNDENNFEYANIFCSYFQKNKMHTTKTKRKPNE